MNVEEAITAYSLMPPERQLRTLASYAFELTIVARGTYVAGTEDIADPRRLRLLNEMQHRVTAQIGHLLDENMNRYPDDVLVRIVVDVDDGELIRVFDAAIRRCD